MHLFEISQGFTRGSKAHHDAVAAHRGASPLTWSKFIALVKKSTMSQRDINEVVENVLLMAGDEVETLRVTRAAVEQLSAIADVDLRELLDIAGM